MFEKEQGRYAVNKFSIFFYILYISLDLSFHLKPHSHFSHRKDNKKPVRKF